MLRAILRKKGGRNAIYSFLVIGLIHLLSPSLMKRQLDYALSRFTSKEIVRKINGVDMILSLEDGGISRQLIMYGGRETLMTDYLLHSGMIGEGDVVLDIGANIEYYVLLESRLVGRTGKIYAIEPVSSNIHVLERNLLLNDCTNVETYRLAMGDRSGSTTIHISDQSNLSALQKESGINYIRTEQVNIVTVDAFLEDKEEPDLIRMDVEGYEYFIFRGMERNLKKDVDLLIEIHGFIMTSEQVDVLFNMLKDHGYRVKYCVADYLHNINKLANVVIDKTNVWRTPEVLHLDIDELHKRIAGGSGAHCLFSKGEKNVHKNSYHG